MRMTGFLLAVLITLVSGGRLAAASLYVSNETTGVVSAYDPATGALQGNLGTFGLPVGLTIRGNSLYVADLTNNAIYSINTQGGGVSPFLSLPGGSGPFQLAFDGSGNAYVSALLTGLVYEFDSNGNQIATFNVPRARGITYDPFNGNLYVVSTPGSDGAGGSDVIDQLTPGGALTSFITSNLNGPRYIAIDSSGTFYVANANVAGGNSAGFLNIYNGTTGAFQSTFATGLGAADEIALTGGGLPLYVATYFDNEVIKCTAADTCSVFINQGSGVGTGGLALGPTVSLTPEPSSAGLIAGGILLLEAVRRRRARV